MEISTRSRLKNRTRETKFIFGNGLICRWKHERRNSKNSDNLRKSTVQLEVADDQIDFDNLQFCQDLGFFSCLKGHIEYFI